MSCRNLFNIINGISNVDLYTTKNFFALITNFFFSFFLKRVVIEEIDNFKISL